MKLNTIAPQKSRAQAMVEFAIVLPLLLLLVYGLLEAGRLLFMYSTIVTATRQASRYGSASGDGSTPGVPRYQDCFGIRQAAQRVDFLNAFADSDISIAYDNGEGQPVTGFDGTCDGDSDSGVTPSTNNDTRIVVTIAGNYFPIVPRIVPFLERSVASGDPITATSARTIIVGISIEVTSPPGSGPPPPGTFDLTISMTATPSSYMFAGDVINFSYNVTNSGQVDLSGIALTPTHGAISCPGTTLAVGASMTCTGSYVITSTDITARTVLAQATATATDGTSTVTSNTATVTLTFVEQPELTLAKSASAEYATTGNTIVYTFALTNSGNVPLTAPTITDAQLGAAFACGGDLAPLASTSCTANYVVTAADVTDNQLVNSATASALYNSQTITSNTASVSVWTGPLFLRVSTSPATVSAANQSLTYTYEIINNTGVPLYPPYTLSGHRGAENCSPNTGGLPAGVSFTCTGTYTVTQPDLDTRASLDNTVSMTACLQSNNGTCPGGRTVTSNQRSVSVTLARNPGLSMSIVSAGPNPSTTLNAVLTYTYAVTNTGNVTLTPSITDTVITNATCPGTLAPGATINCSGTYTVTQADLDAGSITNQAVATAIFNSQTVSSTSQSVTLITYPAARARLGITPNPTTFTGVGQFIVYTYTLTNTGDRPLFGPYSVSDSKVTFVDCVPATNPLPIGASTNCVGSYATTQADMDAGNIITSANIIASDGTQIVTSNSAMTVVYVPGAPTLTPIGGPTSAPTPTRTPTTGPTAVTGCGNITATNITTPTNTMTMTITNPNAYTVTVSTVAVTWNPTGGTGNPGTLTLQSAQWNGTTFWTGSNASGSLTITPSTTLTIPANSSRVIAFNFDRNYQTESGESITINLSTPGCGSTPIRKP